MKAEIYWISGVERGRLAIMPRPRSGDWLEDEVQAWRIAGIDVVISLLTPFEVMELGLQSELQLCQARGMEFVSYPVGDRQVPVSVAATVTLAQRIDDWLTQGKNVAVHCRAGIGRSSLLAACVLTKQGINVDMAFESIRTARGVEVPDTEEQKRWVDHFAQDSKRG